MRSNLRKSVMFIGTAAALCLIVGGAAVADSVGREVDDAVITTRIDTTLLLNEHLSPFSIKVSTKAGVVTLVGGVSDTSERQLAEDLARSVDGVKDVVNKITVVPATKPLAPKRGLKQKAEDLTVSASVRGQLLYYSELKGLTIGVKTENNVVTLSGVVETEEQKKRIGELANDTRGVDGVVNNLTVAAKKGIDSANDVGRALNDQWIADRIRTRILMNRYVSIRKLDVNVRAKECILTGTVDTAEQRQLAGSIAENTPGVKSVRNEIRLRSENTPEPPLDQKAPEQKPPMPELPPLDKPLDTAPPAPEMIEPSDTPSGSAPAVKEERLPAPNAAK
ncbi:MAG: BON domain-containing protein [Candidatus Hydrogenedentes bacterium]|nr:BON domain-containing protein [Candidatus Hydrogenedentota bacterium]